MLKSILDFVRSIFNDPVLKNDMDSYIAAGNPKSIEDVERLEEEFRMQRKSLNNFY